MSFKESEFRHICLVNGPGGHGKDQFIAYAANCADEHGIPTHNFSSIDPCREVSLREFGYDPRDKSEEARKKLIEIKQAWINRDPHGPNRYLLDACKKVGMGLMFLHVREPAQIRQLTAMGSQRGVLIETLHVERPGHPIPHNPIDMGTHGTSSEPFIYDTYISNNGGLEELEVQARGYVIARITTPFFPR